MSYERKDISALITAFRSAKKYLSANPESKFLCHAIEISGKDESIKSLAKDLVNEAINGCFTLGGYYSWGIEYQFGRKKETELRILWCDKIIRDLQEYAK